MAILFVGECEFDFFVTTSGCRQRADFLVYIYVHELMKVLVLIVIFGFDLCSQPKGFVCV